ncbi:hypothetical protein CR513_47094, partial [Mucuna pruriens]
MRELGEKLEKVGRGLDSVQKDTQSVNTKGVWKEETPVAVGRVLGPQRVKRVRNMKNKKGVWKEETPAIVGGILGPPRVKGVGNMKKKKEEPKEEEVDMTKCKIPPFFGNCDSDTYLDRELKVEQILNYFNLHGRMVVRIVTLKFGDYVLVWWMQFLDNLKSHRVKELCED